MRDAKVSLPRVLQLHPAIRQQVIDTITKLEDEKFPATVMIRVVQAVRTVDEQNALYALGRTKAGNRVTNAKGGQSIHNYGLAIDFALMYDIDGNGTYESLSWDTLKDFDKDGKADWTELVEAFKALGYTWGGDFKSIPDSPHLEKNFGRTWKDFKLMYDEKKFIAGTTYVNFNY